MKSIKLLCVLVALSMFFGWTVSVWASKADCGKPPNDPAKPAVKVGTEDPNVQNDYTKVVAETPGAVYLTVVNGAQPKPNACGLNPNNAAAEWTGWGGPLDGDNVTIGEGAQIAGTSIVHGNVPAGARWGGMPAKPLKQWFREMMLLERLARDRGVANPGDKANADE